MAKENKEILVTEEGLANLEKALATTAYITTKDKNGNIIHFKKDIKHNTQYTLHFIDGEVNITIDKN